MSWSDKWLSRVWPWIALALPCWYFWPLDTLFPQDWENQLWMFDYHAQCIWESGRPAMVLNYLEGTCVGTPLFYGTFIYPFGGLLTLILGPALAFRVLVLAIFALDYFSIVRLGRSYSWPVPLQHLVATLMLWAIYPMTNLYWRGATAELWASALLMSSLCSFIQVLRDPTSPRTRYDRYAWGFYFLIAGSTHVLTAYLAFPILAAIGLGGWLAQSWPGRKALLKQVAVTGVAACVIQLSWLYLVVHYSSHLSVVREENTTRTFLEMSKIFDTQVGWANLLSPLTPHIPLDGLTFKQQVGIAIFIGVRVSTSLFLLVVGTVLVTRSVRLLGSWLKFDRWLFYFGLLLTAVAFCTLGLPVIGKHMASIIGIIQFPYRLANYVNDGLFLAFVGWMARPIYWGAVRRGKLWKLSVAVLLLAGLSLFSKLAEVPAEPGAGKRWLTMAGSEPGGSVPSYYGRSDYAITAGLSEFHPAAHTPFVAVCPHGRVSDNPTGSVTLSQPGWVMTQVEPFPWDRLLLDGVLLQPSQLTYYREPTDLTKVDYAVWVPAGKHELEFQFQPPTWWFWARISSFFGTAAWGLVLIRKALQKI